MVVGSGFNSTLYFIGFEAVSKVTDRSQVSVAGGSLF